MCLYFVVHWKKRHITRIECYLSKIKTRGLKLIEKINYLPNIAKSNYVNSILVWGRSAGQESNQSRLIKRGLGITFKISNQIWIILINSRLWRHFDKCTKFSRILVFNFNWLGFNHEGTLIGSSCGLLKNWENAISSFPTSHKRNVNFEETTRKSRLLIHNSVLNRAYNTFLNNQVSKVFEIEKTWKKTKSKYIIFKRTYNSMENS